MKRLIIIVSCLFALASSLDKKRKKKRDVFDSSEIDENALARSYEEDDDIDVRELPSTDERKKFEGIDWEKVKSNDHMTMHSEKKKDKKLTIFVELNPKLERAETRRVVEEWQGNMINCCNIEFGAAFIHATTVIVTMMNGGGSFEFAKMIRQSKDCYSYKVEKDEFLCPAHPLWDKKNPSMYKKKIEKYIPQQKRRDRDIKIQNVNVWKNKGLKADGTRYKSLSPYVGLKENEEL